MNIFHEKRKSLPDIKKTGKKSSDPAFRKTLYNIQQHGKEERVEKCIWKQIHLQQSHPPQEGRRFWFPFSTSQHSKQIFIVPSSLCFTLSSEFSSFPHIEHLTIFEPSIKIFMQLFVKIFTFSENSHKNVKSDLYRNFTVTGIHSNSRVLIKKCSYKNFTQIGRIKKAIRNSKKLPYSIIFNRLQTNLHIGL